MVRKNYGIDSVGQEAKALDSPKIEQFWQGIYLIICLIEALVMAYQTKFLGYGVDALSQGQDVTVFILGFIGLALGILALETCGQLSYAHYQKILTIRLRATIIGNELRKDRAILSADLMGEIISLLNVTVPVLVKEYYLARLQIIVNLAMATVYFVVLLSLPWPYLVTIAIVTCLTVLIPYLFKARIARLRLDSLARQEEYNAVIRDSLAGFHSAKLALGLGMLERKASNTSMAQAKSEFAYQRMVVASNISVGAANFTSKIAVFICGVILVSLQVSSIGQFITVFTMLSLVINPIVSTARQLSLYQGGSATKTNLMKRCPSSVGELADFPALIKTGSRNSFEDLAWHNIEIEIPNSSALIKVTDGQIFAGRKLRIIGDNGAGKSTFLRTLVGLVNPSRGRVAINNFDTYAINESDLLSAIQYVPQEAKVFKGTVFENVDLDRGFSSTQVQAVLDLVELDLDLTQNIDESSISGGERQKITLARALISAPEVLILDEALSQIAVDTRKRLWEILTKEEKLAIIYVSHVAEVANEDSIKVEKIKLD